MEILLVEDDDRIADPLAEDLRHQSNAVDIAYDGLAGWEFTQSADYDVILLVGCFPNLMEFNSANDCTKNRATN